MSKSEKNQLSYIEIRGRTLEEIFSLLQHDEKFRIDDLVGNFMTGSKEDKKKEEENSMMREHLNYLVSLDLVKPNVGGDNETYSAKTKEPDFKVALLKSFRASEDKSFYSLQDLLAQMDALLVNSDTILKEAEKNLSFGFSWNREKLGFFTNIADFIGIGKKLGSSFLNRPSNELIMTMIVRFSRAEGEEFALRGFTDDLCENFIQCYTPKDALYKGLQWVLHVLENEGKVILRAESDASERIAPLVVWDKPVSLVRVQGDIT